MSAQYYYDNNSLYIEHNDCTPDQVRDIITEVFGEIAVLDSADKSTPQPSGGGGAVGGGRRVKYVPRFFEGKPRSMWYVADERDFYRILGNNADGTPHLVTKFVESKTDSADKKQFWQAGVTSWADESDLEREVIGKTDQTKESLIRNPRLVVVDEEDSLAWRDRVKSGQIAVMKARASRVFDHLMPNVLLLRGFASGTTVNTVRDLIAIYSHSTVKTRDGQLLYPIVEARGNMFVATYDPDREDCYFAQMMMHQSKLASGSVITAQYGQKNAGGGQSRPPQGGRGGRAPAPSEQHRGSAAPKTDAEGFRDGRGSRGRKW